MADAGKKIKKKQQPPGSLRETVRATLVPLALCDVHLLISSRCKACLRTRRTHVCKLHADRHVLVCGKCRGKSHFAL